IVVGLKCDAGKQVRLLLNSRSRAVQYQPGFGASFDCTGKFEDYELVFSELEVAYGTAPKGFDPAHTMSLSIEYVDAAPPSSLSLQIAGIAVDQSALELVGVR